MDMNVESYSFGEITINDTSYKNDVIIYPGSVKDNWWRKEGHLLHLEDLAEVLEYDPDRLIIGTGAYGVMKVPENVKRKLKEQGIEVEVFKTGKACEKFNQSRGKTVAVLHLTC